VAYQVLARKWRPKSFDSLKGQWHVVRALMNAIARGHYHHAYLFTGTRGVGKTSIARILAKAFNCEKGITSTPCGQCSACLEIDAGRFVDLLEIDAASRTRVEDTRELLDNVQYAPTQGRFKIYLIDEVHMLSGHSFNALLKTLEEPPPHVIFILATTDPERIPITVLSRCLRFNLRALPATDIADQLKEILTQENIPFEMSALDKLARLAHGSMRDALSLLEQAIAFSDGNLRTQEVEDMLGISYERSLPALVKAVLTLDIEACIRITHDIGENGADFEEVCSSLLKAIHTLSLSKAMEGDKALLFSVTDVDPSIVELKDSISAEELQLLYQIGLIGKRDLRYAPDCKTGFEMVLLRMIAFRPCAPVVSSPAASVAPRQVTLSERTPIAAPPAASVVVPQSERHSESERSPALQQSPRYSGNDNTAFDWSKIVTDLPLTGLSAVLVKHCVVASWGNDRLELTLDSVNKACLNESRQQQIQEAMSEMMGRPIRVVITPGEIRGQTPSMQVQAAAKAREDQAVQSIQQDSLVKNILSAFDAEVDKITVVDNEEA
jgi:DNA polymerase III subunit gamma/tau